MIQLLSASPMVFLIVAVALVTAITIHEFAHAMAAEKLGDPTPRLQGRLSLNPLAHLDPFGTLLLLIAGIGWGKPVQFDPYNLKDPRKDAAIISLAGPLSNIILATLLALVLRFLQTPFSPLNFFYYAIEIIIGLNITLAIFNLIPIHPLDGGKILTAFLPRKDAYAYDRFMSQYGIFVLLFLILPLVGGRPAISLFIEPVWKTIMGLLLPAGPTV